MDKRKDFFIIDISTSEVLICDRDSCTHVEKKLAESNFDVLDRVLKERKSDLKCKNVVICSSDFFVQNVRLSKTQLKNLKEEDLLSLLGYEVEPFSNISIQDGLIAYARREELGDSESEYMRVLQVSKNEISQYDTLLRKYGYRLCSVAESIPRHVDEKSVYIDYFNNSSCLRIDCKKNAIDSILENYVKIAIAASICVIAICVLVHMFMQVKSSSLDRKIDEIMPLNNKVLMLSNEVSKQDKEISSIKTAKAKFFENRDLSKSLANAWNELFNAFEKVFFKRAVIKKIDITGSYKIKVAIVVDGAERGLVVMSDLEKAFSGIGWKVVSDKKQFENKKVEDGFIEIEFEALYTR